jgi:putative membrane protein
VVPGVSGGTIALILGIYHRFIGALAQVDHRLLALVAGVGRRDGRAAFVRHARETDLWFLVQLGFGIATAIVAGAHVVGGLIARYPQAMMALFFGLILSSARIPWRGIDRPRPSLWWAAAAGVVVAAAVGLLPAQATEPALWFLFVAGALALTAMLLPGVSGSALLVLLGVYPAVLTAVREVRLVPLAVFAVGAAVGILLASRGVRAALRYVPSFTLATLTGLMVGSAVRVWPWRTAAAFGEGLPEVPATWVPLVFMALGVALSLGLERLGVAVGTLGEDDADPVAAVGPAAR